MRCAGSSRTVKSNPTEYRRVQKRGRVEISTPEKAGPAHQNGSRKADTTKPDFPMDCIKPTGVQRADHRHRIGDENIPWPQCQQRLGDLLSRN
jgi:hypothetical protein